MPDVCFAATNFRHIVRASISARRGRKSRMRLHPGVESTLACNSTHTMRDKLHLCRWWSPGEKLRGQSDLRTDANYAGREHVTFLQKFAVFRVSSYFYSASQNYWNFVWLCVCLSVCHTSGLCRNGLTLSHRVHHQAATSSAMTDKGEVWNDHNFQKKLNSDISETVQDRNIVTAEHKYDIYNR